MKNKLNIQSIFDSLDGEVNGFSGAGELCTFIRLKGCNLRCEYCFTGGVLVNTPVGVRKIKELKPGDKVLSYNFNKQEVEEDEVESVFRREVKKVIRLMFENRSRKIFVTPDHPFYTVEKKWVRAEDLREGQQIFELRRFAYMCFHNPRQYMSKEQKKIIALKVSSKTRGRKQSKKAIQKIRKAKQQNPTRNFGERNGNWRGGIAKLKYSHCYKEWHKLRREVLQRDNYTCQKCGEKRDLVVHHLDFDSTHNALDNLCALCRKCNSSISHGRYSFVLSNGAKIIEKAIIDFSSLKSYVRLAGRKKGEISVFNIKTRNKNYFVERLLVHNCDTKYAQESEPANWMTIDEIVKKVHFPKVTITGGEALMQRREVVSLISALRKRNDFDNICISIETNGSIPIPFDELSYCCFIKDDRNVRWVVDYKLPSSGMEDKMDLSVFSSLRDIDVIKFVISDEKDYKRACSLIKKHPEWVAKKVFSPVVKIRRGVRVDTKFKSEKLNRFLPIFVPFEFVDPEWPRQLVEMMIQDKVPAQFSLQLHKILWPGAKGER